MKKVFILVLGLSLISCFSKGQDQVFVKQVNDAKYIIESARNECAGLPLVLTKDKFLKDWAYSTETNSIEKNEFSNEESNFLSCLIDGISNTSDIVRGSKQIRIRFELRALQGVFLHDGIFRKSVGLLKGTVKDNDFSLAKELSNELSSYSSITSFCDSVTDLGYVCDDNFIDMNPPKFEVSILGMNKSELANLDYLGFPNNLWISLTLSKH